MRTALLLTVKGFVVLAAAWIGARVVTEFADGFVAGFRIGRQRRRDRSGHR